jgi:hypothetical protein
MVLPEYATASTVPLKLGIRSGDSDGAAWAGVASPASITPSTPKESNLSVYVT